MISIYTWFEGLKIISSTKLFYEVETGYLLMVRWDGSLVTYTIIISLSIFEPVPALTPLKRDELAVLTNALSKIFWNPLEKLQTKCLLLRSFVFNIWFLVSYNCLSLSRVTIHVFGIKTVFISSVEEMSHNTATGRSVRSLHYSIALALPKVFNQFAYHCFRLCKTYSLISLNKSSIPRKSSKINNYRLCRIRLLVCVWLPNIIHLTSSYDVIAVHFF